MEYRVWDPNCKAPGDIEVPIRSETPGEAAQIVAKQLDKIAKLFPDDLDGDDAELRVAHWDDQTFKVIYRLEMTLRVVRHIEFRERFTS